MNKKVSVLLCIATIFAVFTGCKKEEEEKKLSLDFQVTPFPSNGSSAITPTAAPYLVFSKKVDYSYFDQYTGKNYKVIIDSSLITNSQNAQVPSQINYSLGKDTLKFNTNEDFPSSDTYKVRLKYHVEVKNDNGLSYDHYIYKGEPQDFQFESTFSTGDYLYFDPNFVLTAHPASGTVLSYLLSPYLTFNKKIDGLYLNTDLNRNYKICIDSAGIYTSSLQSISLGMVYSNAKDTLKLVPTNLLDAGNEYQIKLKYHVEVKNKSTETFQILRKEGVPYYGRFSSSFSSTSLTSAIDTSAIEYAYPSPYQYHFLRNETTRGVLKLKAASKSSSNGMNRLNAAGTTFKVRFSTLTGQNWTSDATYNTSEQKFIFQIPSSNLENQKIYKIEYIMVSTSGSEAAFLTYHFRTSKYNTFEEKFNSAFNFIGLQRYIVQGVYQIIKEFTIPEGFDKAEGKDYLGLIRFVAIPGDNSFWTKFNRLYNGMITNNYSLDRKSYPISIPPLNNIVLNKNYFTPSLSQTQIESGVANDYGEKKQSVYYDLALIFHKDYWDIRGKINNRHNGQSGYNEWENLVVNQGYSAYPIGSYYYIKLYYIAGDVVTYSNSDFYFHYF